MRFRYVLMPIVVTRLDITFDALLALFGMVRITFFGVDAARWRDLLDAGTDADPDINSARRARRRRRRRRRLVALFVS